MALSRLLLLFDYFIRQLYEPGAALIAQIQYNLFNDETSHEALLSSTGNSTPSTRKPPATTPPETNRRFPLLFGDRSKKEGKKGKEDENPDQDQLPPPSSKPLPPSRVFCDCAVLDKLWNWNTNEDDEDGDEGDNAGEMRPKFYNLLQVRN